MPNSLHSLPPTVALERAALICQERGQRFTPLRRQVLEALLEAGHPLGAYDLLQVLAARLRKPVSPPTAYRALDFLQAQGLVHRIESCSAFVPCLGQGGDHPGVFLICEACGGATEVEPAGLGAAIEGYAQARGFSVSRSILELQGLCASCQDCGSAQ